MTRQPPTVDQVRDRLKELQQPYVEPLTVLNQMLQDFADNCDARSEAIIATVTSQTTMDGGAPALRHGVELTQIIHNNDLHLYVSDDGDLIKRCDEYGRVIYSPVDLDPAAYPSYYGIDQLNQIIDAAARLLSEQIQR
ncbi:MAG: hypothetical protein ABIR91_01475 [Candidatus Saccharimonadales bacterium]